MLNYLIFCDGCSCFEFMMLQEGNRIKLAAAALPKGLFGYPERINLSEIFGWCISKHQPVRGRQPGQSVPALTYRQQLSLGSCCFSSCRLSCQHRQWVADGALLISDPPSCECPSKFSEVFPQVMRLGIQFHNMLFA